MKPTVKTIRDKVERLKNDLKEAESSLSYYVNNCRHSWGKVQADHIYEKAYTIPGDPPGTMGVDWRGPCYVPAKETKRWKRVCEECGKEEFTTNTEQHVTYTPKF